MSIFLKIRQCEDDYSTKSELKFDSVKLLMHRLCSMIIVDLNDKEIHSKLIGNSIDLLHRQLYLLLISGLTMQTVMHEMVFELREFLSSMNTPALIFTFKNWYSYSLHCRFLKQTKVYSADFSNVKMIIRQCKLVFGTVKLQIRRCKT